MICAVDPGRLGAIAWLTDDGKITAVNDMPVVDVRGKLRVSAQLLKPLFSMRAKVVFIEEVHAIAGSGAANGFSFGQAAGLVEGVCAGLGLPIVMVKPLEWKRALKLTADKGLSLQMAIRLWPEMASYFARKKDDGRSEAALVGYYGLKFRMEST